MTKLRVWHNCQVGAVKNFYVEVESIEQAWKILNTLWDYDLFQYENNIKPDYQLQCKAFVTAVYLTHVVPNQKGEKTPTELTLCSFYFNQKGFPDFKTFT